MFSKLYLPFQPKVIPYRTYREKNNFKPVWLDDETYGKAKEAFVIDDVDILIVNRVRRTFYLAKRRIEPMPYWWGIGGRFCAGEDAYDAAKRHFLTDTGIDIRPERLDLVALHEYVWNKRAQEPQDGGSHNLAFTFVVELSDDEIAAIPRQLNPDEYDVDAGLREFNREELINLEVHSSVINLYDQLFSYGFWRFVAKGMSIFFKRLFY